MEGEPIHETWERFKSLLAQCPHHQYPLAPQVQFFYDGLTFTTQDMIDFAARQYIGDKTPKELVAIYELLSRNFQQKAIWGKRASVHEMFMQKDLGSQGS